MRIRRYDSILFLAIKWPPYFVYRSAYGNRIIQSNGKCACQACVAKVACIKCVRNFNKRIVPYAETRVMQKKPEAPVLYPIGTIVIKKFEKGRLRAIHCGEVKRYDEDRKYY